LSLKLYIVGHTDNVGHGAGDLHVVVELQLDPVAVDDAALLNARLTES
jgi:hypothetical protein